MVTESIPPVTEGGSTSSSSPILEVTGVSKSFGGVRAVDAVSFQVRAGWLTSVIGPNGAGKTTLFGVITGLMKPTAGRVTFKGIDVTGWPAYRIAKAGLSRTFQNVQLFPSLNVIENVIAARSVRTRSTYLETLLFLPRPRQELRESVRVAEQLLEAVGIADRRYLSPAALPYGEQRRLEIARALATEPELLVLDEPVAGMIASEAESLMGLMSDLRQSGKTILLIEHNMTLVMSISDHIVALNFGRKIAEGSPPEIQSNAAVIEAYLGEDD